MGMVTYITTESVRLMPWYSQETNGKMSDVRIQNSEFR
jgi:hypothetical protein